MKAMFPKLVRQPAATIARASATINSSASLYRAMMAEYGSKTVVTEDTAMRLTAVFSCVRVLMEDQAKLPLIVYKRIPRGKERAPDHWLSALLEQPNEWQTGVEMREVVHAHIELGGNSYLLKTVVRGEVRELLPVAPSRVTVKWDPRTYTISYVMSWPDGSTTPVPLDRIVHFRGPSLDGVMGLSPVAWQKETMTLGMDLLKYGTALFENGTMLGGVLKHPGPAPLSDDAARRLKESFDEKYSGIQNAHKTVLLEEGTEYVATAMKSTDAQYIESQKYSRSQIASIYRVPLHMIGDLERATFSNIEHQSREYVQNALLPRLTRFEHKLSRALLPTAERKQFFVEHLVDGLLRGDYQQRMAGYQVAIQSGWMTRNQARELENMNPGPPELDEYLVPLNMRSSDDPPPAPTPPKTAPKEGDDDAAA